jgi:hypothetical protein
MFEPAVELSARLDLPHSVKGLKANGGTKS